MVEKKSGWTRLDATTALLVVVLATWLTPSKLQGQESQSNADPEDLVADTQQSLHVNGYIGLVWWIPQQFWEASLPPATAKNMIRAFANYTIVALAAAKKGADFRLEWVSESDFRSNVALRDLRGSDYRPLSAEEVSPVARGILGAAKSVFASTLGQFGENVAVLFFPSVGKDGKLIANPITRGDFSVVIKGILGADEKLYTYRLPLTSLTPPRFCPVGKERVKADWLYCPWHGVPLDSAAPPSSSPSKPSSPPEPAKP